MDPDVLRMIATIAGVNLAAILLLAVLSYGMSHLLLNALTIVDRWLDPSSKPDREISG
ncbi:MAG TPA: hypothetical protein VG734_20975 [Lacunisphaera sp.]|nr:hypothetical protein [Lacunisphaera sp.]